jgi:hypothetical protein
MPRGELETLQGRVIIIALVPLCDIVFLQIAKGPPFVDNIAFLQTFWRCLFFDALLAHVGNSQRRLRN